MQLDNGGCIECMQVHNGRVVGWVIIKKLPMRENGFPFLHEIFARGEDKNRMLCNEDTAGCVLLEDQSFTCLVPSLKNNSKNHL